MFFRRFTTPTNDLAEREFRWGWAALDAHAGLAGLGQGLTSADPELMDEKIFEFHRELAESCATRANPLCNTRWEHKRWRECAPNTVHCEKGSRLMLAQLVLNKPCPVQDPDASHSEERVYTHATRGLLETDHVILNHGQVTRTTPELAPPLLTTTPHQREDVSAHDRFNVYRCPTRRDFSGTGLELLTCLP
ncbi:uncharacterized protein TNCV_1076631 [Trichonephila clavipes]|uniref:Uncharacterized protein n=1 Tax=Trichonephila clavipes TaxID=2585209 RepID=A0A8X6V713_TRICX|nr:uncharacterized protein TNCV_1076631 [Trichonephila clavipes]